MTLKQITLYIILPLVAGFLLATALVTSAAAATVSKEEAETRLATALVVGWTSPTCATVYPNTYELKVAREDILMAIQAEAEAAATDQGLPRDHYYADVIAVLKKFPTMWAETPEEKRQAMCANISKGFPNILKRHVSI